MALNFPTDKKHISYSEIKQWKECSYRHRLMYIDKINTFEESVYLDFGTIVHAAIEDFLKSGEMDIDGCVALLRETWEKKGFDSSDYIEAQKLRGQKMSFNYKHENVEAWVQSAKNILSALPAFLDENFPDWEVVSAEERLYESIENSDIKFKGFIDCVVKVKDRFGKDQYWIIDWKTAGPRGWNSEKRRDFLLQAQIGLYKSYWARKNNIPLKSIRCGFILLKRGSKQEKCINLVKVSVGPKFVERSSKLVNNMVASVKRGMFIKNRFSCKFCPFYQTEHCT